MKYRILGTLFIIIVLIIVAIVFNSSKNDSETPNPDTTEAVSQ